MTSRAARKRTRLTTDINRLLTLIPTPLLGALHDYLGRWVLENATLALRPNPHHDPPTRHTHLALLSQEVKLTS